MRTLRAAITISICMWLVLPGSHAFALCIGHSGGVALEVAVGDGCGCSSFDDGGEQHPHVSAITPHKIGGRGVCTDLVLRGAGEAIPPAGASAKHAREQRMDDVTQAAPHCAGSQLQTGLSTEFLSLAPSPERPPTTGFTVLRL